LNFLLDTNVVSEWKKPLPDTGMIAWLSEVDEDRIFLSVVTLAELRHGIERLPHGHRRIQLDQWLKDDLPARFESRILPIDPMVADAWGLVVAMCAAAGRPISAMDAFVAATAQVHNLTLVTRNTSDFEVAPASVVNPWARPQSA
jgi:predicted nucleic acid-binding protein